MSQILILLNSRVVRLSKNKEKRYVHLFMSSKLRSNSENSAAREATRFNKVRCLMLCK